MDWTRDERMMALALAEARKAQALGEVPVGAVIARGDEVIATGYNLREREKNALRHAELTAIANLPSREGLLSMLCSALQGNIRGLAVALNAVAEKKQEEGAA